LIGIVVVLVSVVSVITKSLRIDTWPGWSVAKSAFASLKFHWMSPLESKLRGELAGCVRNAERYTGEITGQPTTPLAVRTDGELAFSG